MPEPLSYDFAVIRVAPRVERGEFVNAGVVVYCRLAKFLGGMIRVDEGRLRALWADADIAEIHRHLSAIPKICEGDSDAGPVARMPQSERFHWLTSPRSTVIQVSPVHSGICESPQAALEDLFRRLVE